MLNNWRKFRRLSRPERWVLIQACLALPLTVLALRLVGLRLCQATLARLTPVRGVPSGQPPELLGRQAATIARLLGVVARRYPLDHTCLPQSLTLWWLLRCRGIESDVRIGVRKEAGLFQAHAWVELSGLVLNDRADVHGRFAPFDQPIRPVEVRAL